MDRPEVTRKLAAVMAADVAGYSRLMGMDEEGTLSAMNALLADIVEPCIAAHQGRIFKKVGDGFLAEFASVVETVRCALEIQEFVDKTNANLPSETRIEFRIGINLGDVMVEGDDLYGDGVNVAARLQELASPGGICLSGGARDQVQDRFGFSFEDRGEVRVKNIRRQIRLYVVSQGSGAPSEVEHYRVTVRRILSRQTWLTTLALVAVVVIGVFWWYSEASSRRQAEEGERRNVEVSRGGQKVEFTKASIAVLPFDNLSADSAQEYLQTVSPKTSSRRSLAFEI